MEITEIRYRSLIDLINRSHEVHLPMNTMVKVMALTPFKLQVVYKHEKEYQEWHEIEFRDACPIPITREILLSVGAIFPYENERLQIGGICFSFDSKLGLFVNDSGYNEAISKRIKYLHQLQNVCLDLDEN